MVLLPGDGVGGASVFLPGAYLVESIEHIYTPAERKTRGPHEARLTKAVAQVTSLNPAMMADPAWRLLRRSSRCHIRQKALCSRRVCSALSALVGALDVDDRTPAASR